jgi:hypothetical protein
MGTEQDVLVYYKQINDLVTKNLKKINDRDELDYNQFWSAVLSLTADIVKEKDRGNGYRFEEV